MQSRKMQSGELVQSRLLCKITYDVRQNREKLQNFGCFCRLRPVIIVSTHIHSPIEAKLYMYIGIRGGSWGNPRIRNDDHPRQAARRRQVFTTGSQREGKVSIHTLYASRNLHSVSLWRHSIDRTCHPLTRFRRVYNDKPFTTRRFHVRYSLPFAILCNIRSYIDPIDHEVLSVNG